MPPKTKTVSPKTEEPTDEVVKPDKEEEVKTEVTKVPSWRAEVVEEGAEEDLKETPPVVEEPLNNEALPEASTDKDLGVVKPEADTSSLDLTMPQEPQEGKGKKLFIIVFVAVLITGLIVGGLLYYKSRVGSTDKPQSESDKVATPTLSVTLSPTPAVEVKMEDYKVSVLNGSGIPGEANKVKELLSKEGFKTMTTGNAEAYTYTISEISLKKATPDTVYQAVKKALSGYKIIKQEKTLEDSGNVDVQIIIGSTKAEPTPTSSP